MRIAKLVVSKVTLWGNPGWYYLMLTELVVLNRRNIKEVMKLAVGKR